MSGLTDTEIERIVGEFISLKAPLPPEISLNRAGSSFFEFQTLIELYGLDTHPLVRIIRENKVKAGMAHAIDHGAPYVNRIAHYLAGQGYEGTLKAFILQMAAEDDPENNKGRDQPPSPSEDAVKPPTATPGGGTATGAEGSN